MSFIPDRLHREKSDIVAQELLEASQVGVIRDRVSQWCVDAGPWGFGRHRRVHLANTQDQDGSPFKVHSSVGQCCEGVLSLI